MKLDDKKIVINNFKIKLEYLIKEGSIQLPINLNNIKINLIEHYNFINFIESINIYEKYKWDKLKEDYNRIKKKVNRDKKIYLKIINYYGIVNNYYTHNENNDIEIYIKKINENTEILKLEFEKLIIIHNIFINKSKNYIKNMKIIKVDISNKESSQLIKRLYQIYYELKILKKDIKLLKSSAKN